MDDFLALYEEANEVEFPETRVLEEATGFRLEDAWLGQLALTTQVVFKKSALNWQHGRLLYSFLRQLIQQKKDAGGREEAFTILETGTARGFSSICMAKAILDSRADGRVITIDPLPHDKKMFWNCIKDVEGRHSRRELLASWESELSRILFFEGSSREVFGILAPPRIHFAFLDAQHTYRQVLGEFSYVSARQVSGDIIFFDDVTPGKFAGVVRAVKQIENEGLYSISYFGRPADRGYAVATRR